MTIWPSFARKRVRRPRPSTSTCAQYICCAGRCKRAPLRSRISLLHPQRPRAAASSGAAAAGQETSRSPAQRGRRPPAVLRGARRKAGPRATGGWLSSACTARLAALPALPTPVSARGLLDGRRPPGAPRAARSGRRPPSTRPGCGLDRGPGAACAAPADAPPARMPFQITLDQILNVATENEIAGVLDHH